MIIVLTAFDDAKVAKLQAHQVHAVIRKPFDTSQLVTMIHEVVMMWQAQTAGSAVERLPTQTTKILYSRVNRRTRSSKAG